MSQFKTILVPLGLTKNDVDIIKYAGFLSEFVGAENFYFIHVNKSLEISSEILKEHPNLLPPLDESLAKDMQREVEENFGDNLKKVECNYQALEGNILSEILHYASVKDVDLILTGSSTSLERTSILSTRLAHKAPCSVLSIPYAAKRKLDVIACPIDFSDHSEKSFQIALKLSKEIGAKLTCIHAYEVPIGYAKAGRTYDEFSEIMKSHAQKSFNKLLSKYKCEPSQVNCEYVLSRHPAKSVREILTRGEIDFLIMGSRGHGAAASFILGSVTEEILLTTQIPVISVKEKGENSSFLKVLLNKKEQFMT